MPSIREEMQEIIDKRTNCVCKEFLCECHMGMVHQVSTTDFGRVLFEPNPGVDMKSLDIQVTVKRKYGWFKRPDSDFWMLRTPKTTTVFDDEGNHYNIFKEIHYTESSPEGPPWLK